MRFPLLSRDVFFPSFLQTPSRTAEHLRPKKPESTEGQNESPGPGPGPGGTKREVLVPLCGRGREQQGPARSASGANAAPGSEVKTPDRFGPSRFSPGAELKVYSVSKRD